MIRYALPLALLAASGFLVPSVRADDAGKKGFQVEVNADIAYRSDKDADPVRHKLDIFTPKGEKDFPVLMFVHGGSWKWGNKAMYASLGATFAKQGIGTVVVNYRLTDKKNGVKHPDHIKDVAAAFAFIHDNIGKYGGRNDRIFIAGHSAGGHLVSLLATDESYLKEHKLGFKDIHGVMPLSGVYEIVPKVFIFDDQFGTDKEVCKAASPINHVGDKHPPFLICYADKDLPTIGAVSESFCKKLADAKCEATALKIEERDHSTIIIRLALNPEDQCTSAMLDFIAKHSEWKRPGK